MGRSFEDVGFSSQIGKLSSSTTTIRLPHWDPSEMFLQTLKDFISERRGILEDGWHVEFKKSKSTCELYAVYCAPDGKKFETMSDVAHYLGLVPNGTSVLAEVRNDDGSTLLHNGLHVAKRRKLNRSRSANGLTESKVSLMSGFDRKLVSGLGKKLEVIEAEPEEHGGDDFQQFNDGLPLQYEDFFVLSLGKVDARASYHDTGQIWPVGYRSCWHDKVTGSLFLFDVSDGGDTGPCFKVRRFSCSALPIPYGTSVLRRACLNRFEEHRGEEIDKMTSPNDDCSIPMMLSDPCLPVEDDVLSWLGSSPSEISDVHSARNPQLEANSLCEKPQRLLSDSTCLGEKLGELSVDGISPSSTWSILSQKLIDACCDVYKKSGSVKFFCKHGEHGISSFHEIVQKKKEDAFSTLDKFCSSLGSVSIPLVIESDNELELAIEALKDWMNSDRFGFDAAFVQETIEKLPGVQGCAQYEHLSSRSNYSMLPVVQNGLLVVNDINGDLGKRDTSGGLFESWKGASSSVVENAASLDRVPPPGKLVGSELPPYLVGDLLQVLELLWRFRDILDPEVSLHSDELERELINPWSDSSYPHEDHETELQGGQIISANGSSILSRRTSSSSSEKDRPSEDIFIEMETAAGREEAFIKSASSTYSRCTGVALRKAHISLLNVLVSELQMRVATVLDPSLDGESKSRRGRRKDVDSSILAIKPKLIVLPINELTWPELARRYILAVLSMDGSIDSAEFTGRECGRVFRCLQGDGGVLCGSLSGVAGIEADAVLLAEAARRIYGSASGENNLVSIEDDDPDATVNCGRTGLFDGSVPEWALALEPVRKLPTNVGTRIRKCVYEALEKDPPEWARKILEHSISKEVYKGNASGPTKKAVLSVLADVHNETSHQPHHKERKKKTVVSVSDIIMRQCRIVLRQAACADDDKVFCNLLGRILTNCSENDDEGLLGTPAMVSRPLDFRTIDLRLAVGAYNGSPEAFLDDVRQLWSNVRAAHADQSDLVQLADTLSENFESLYEKEVVPLIEKLQEYTKSEHTSAEEKKEIADIFVSTSEIPKAPWDEGVCKVCGVDKDDDSVLLCDACDAEYHTYCLDPPLARIPEGNWYCPACVSGKTIRTAKNEARLLGQCRGKKYHGEGVRSYLNELVCLAAALDEREYWDFSVDERTSLLKFLCDELLNSILVRQHIEKCGETSADLQQKLRSLHSDWRNLKLREDILAAKAAKFRLNVPNATEESNIGGDNGATNCFSSLSDNMPQAECVAAETEHTNYLSSCPDLKLLEKSLSCDSKGLKIGESEGRADDTIRDGDCSSHENDVSEERPRKRRKSSELCDPRKSNIPSQEINGTCTQNSEGPQGVSVMADSGSVSAASESQACSLELNAVRKELTELQQSIANAESQLVKHSVRMEFLGSDSFGRLYWISNKPVPRVIVNNTMSLDQSRQRLHHGTNLGHGSISKTSAFDGTESVQTLDGSRALCPLSYQPNVTTPVFSQWFTYESDAELRELILWLKDNDLKEKQLKDSILHWQRTRSHDTRKKDKTPVALEASRDKSNTRNCLITKASALLEKKYGPCFESDTVDNVKKRGKKAKMVIDGKMYRCKCLEPVWHSRHHCSSCHRTFSSAKELETHNGEKCCPGAVASDKGKEPGESFDSPGKPKPDTRRRHSKVDSKTTGSQLASNLVMFQNEGSMCPYKFEEISSKFVTHDSIKELVRGIGFIGSEGKPSFVESESPYLNDPTLSLDLPQCKSPQNQVSLQNSPRISSSSKCVESSEADSSRVGSREEKEKKYLSKSCGLSTRSTNCCVVPQRSLRPLVGRAAEILRQLKIGLLDMEAALPEEAVRPPKVQLEKRWAWRAFVKSADTLFEMVQATIIFEDMIKTEYLKNNWWYWSSMSAAAKTSTLSALALRIYALDNSILYEKPESLSKPTSDPENPPAPNEDPSEKPKVNRRINKKRKEAADG